MPRNQLALKATIALTRPQLLEELFEIRDKKLHCRFCGKEAILTLERKDDRLLAANFGFCDCPRSGERRVKLGTFKTMEVVEPWHRTSSPT